MDKRNLIAMTEKAETLRTIRLFKTHMERTRAVLQEVLAPEHIAFDSIDVKISEFENDLGLRDRDLAIHDEPTNTAMMIADVKVYDPANAGLIERTNELAQRKGWRVFEGGISPEYQNLKDGSPSADGNLVQILEEKIKELEELIEEKNDALNDIENEIDNIKDIIEAVDEEELKIDDTDLAEIKTIITAIETKILHAQ